VSSSEVKQIRVTYYLDVASSWCYWAEPAWAVLKERYAGRVEFDWKIALMDAAGMPTSREQLAWFYKRSGMMMRSPVMLNAEWLVPGASEYPVRNLIAEAARSLGVTDDRVRLALSRAVLLDRKPADNWEVAAAIGAEAGGLDKTRLLELALSPAMEERIRASTDEFYALKVTQRPTFVLDSPIGDRAVFSGFARAAPLIATVESMLEDLIAYAAHAAHFGEPPTDS
jgi:predicted DsbA family dithiol-disulfide isomerase